MAEMNKSAIKVFRVLDVLMRNFYHGWSPVEIVAETGYGASDVSRYLATLIDAGYAERIPETGRVRPSHRLAQAAVQIMHSLDEAQNRVTESRNRLMRG